METQSAVLERRTAANVAADLSRYPRTRDAARYISVAESTLIGWRRDRVGPKPIRLSSNRVVYDRLELDRWMRERTTFERQSGAAAQPAAAHP